MASNEFFSFVTGTKSDVGCIREMNEDSFLARPDYGLWVVADGMGGHAAGDYASQTIVHELNSIGVPGSGDDLQARFMERLMKANDAIYRHSIELDRGTIGATVVALLVHGSDYACIWSGDSRIYRLRDGVLEQQTRDHTEVRALLESGAITKEEAANWPRKNVITRAIGVSEVPECDVMGGALDLGDMFLLCSDGLTEHVTDEEIAEHMTTYPPQEACDALVDLTLSRGAKDNVTVVTMSCMPAPPPEEDPDYAAIMEDFS